MDVCCCQVPNRFTWIRLDLGGFGRMFVACVDLIGSGWVCLEFGWFWMDLGGALFIVICWCVLACFGVYRFGGYLQCCHVFVGECLLGGSWYVFACLGLFQ